MPNDTSEQSAPQKQTLPSSLAGLTKRQQLDKAKRTTFIWVAIAAAVLALSVVLLQFFVKEALFNQKVISKKAETQKIIEQNLENAPELKKNVDALLADDSLAILRANPEDNSLQVILDALPTTGDTTTFSNSLYNKVLQRSGVNMTSVTAGLTDDLAALGGAAPTESTADQASLDPGPKPLPYTVTLIGSQEQVKTALLDVEKTIRPINNKKMVIVAADGALNVTLTGETYFLPRTTVDLGKVTIKP